MCPSPANPHPGEPADAASGYRFTDPEVALLSRLVRDHLRRTARNMRSGAAKFGDAWDPTAAERRWASLRRVYRELGGDPDRISNLPPLGDDADTQAETGD